ncbi:MAG: hypothetical protein IKL59_04215 [Clostridia bacterium]|nr:hypothetical protein [Clostridia bacterium]
MTKTVKIIFAIALSFAFVFMAFGYASLTDDLSIEGSGQLVPKEGFFISDVVQASGSGGSFDEQACMFVDTTVNSTVNVGQNETVILDITVFNNTDVEYGYDAVMRPASDGQNYVYTNEGIIFRLHGLKRPHTVDGVMDNDVTRIAVGATYTFQIEFYHDPDYTGTVQTGLQSVLNFIFKPFEEIDPDQSTAPIEGALDQFASILNNGTDYNALTNEMANNYGGGLLDSANTLTYVGNVAGSKEDDTETLEKLFNGQLRINLDGKDTDVTVMIKRENVDGNTTTGDHYTYSDWRGRETTVSGCEMTLYMTSAQYKDESGKYILQNGDTVTVYAVVFTRQATGEWYQLGDMYKGQTTVNGYEAPWYTGSGSFNTDNWRSSETYYNVGSGATIEAITSAFMNSKF